MSSIREFLIGPPLPTRQLKGERLDNFRALAALSPDALSSIAYANQEIFLGLVVAGAAGLNMSLPIAIAITALLAILTLSYSQTIRAYPTGGGSYTVASENLGKFPGLVAAAALLIDYVLTAAVSLTAGVAAISSAFPVLWDFRIEIALVLLFIITLANLRGLREAGTLISVPVYLFLGSYFAMIVYGCLRLILEGPGTPAVAIPAAAEPVTLFLILHTFSSGCTALTGIEAISNGVTVFKAPEVTNARRVMVVMALCMGVLLLGSITLTQVFGVVATAEETILSALARRIFGDGVLHIFMQVTTLLILLVAANTSFVDFPRVTHLLARDNYLPHQFTNLGDRLVFSNGIMVLSAAVGVLIIAFGGDSHALIPLFAVGVFLAFTLSQSGMVIHWLREKGAGWRLKSIINGVGAVTTALTFVVVAVSKFAEGAWIIAILVPIIIVIFLRIERHYQHIAHELRLEGRVPPMGVPAAPRIVIPISGVHRGVFQAVKFAESLSDRVTALYVETEPEKTEKIQRTWDEWGQGVPLVVVQSPYRSVIVPLLDYLEEADRSAGDGIPAVIVLPEFIPYRWWHNVLHNQTAWLLKLALLYQRRRTGISRVIVDVPFYLHE